MAKKSKKLINFSLIMSIFALSVSLTSFAFLTFSWFSFTRDALTRGPSVGVDKGLSYTLKYFTKNLDGGYPAPGYEIVNTGVEDYATQFVAVDEDFHDWVDFNMLKEPRFRTTFALEVTSYALGSEVTVGFAMDGFTAPPSEDNFNYNNGSPIPITLAEAINLYTIAIDGNQSNSALTSAAHSFVTTNGGVVNQFDGVTSYSRLNEFVVPASTTDHLVIFFFTIEFSGSATTFYKYHSQNTGLQQVYFVKDPSGNSNVFQGLGFKIDKLLITKE